MLIINNNECDVLSNEIKYVTHRENQIFDYTISILLTFKLNDKNGYISFFLDTFADTNYKNIINKKYTENSTQDSANSKINMFEMYDTKEFIDCINGNITIKFGNIIDNTIKFNLYIDENENQVSYKGALSIMLWDGMKIYET